MVISQPQSISIRPVCALLEARGDVEERRVDIGDKGDEVVVVVVVVIVRPLGAGPVHECTFSSAPPQRGVPVPPAV